MRVNKASRLDQKVCVVYCRDIQKAATSAELTTAGSYSCSARGRLLDIEIIFEDVTEYLWDILSRKELLLLLTDCLKKIEVKASLSRKDVVALHKHLHELEGDLIGKDQETLTKWQLDRRRFLKLPRVKQQLEECIGKLHMLADKVDKDHKEHTIFNTAAHTPGAASGTWTLLGLALASVTGGAVWHSELLG